MSVLTEIIKKKSQRINLEKKKFPFLELKNFFTMEELEEGMFLQTLKESVLDIKLIPEIKRKSPSSGMILNPGRDILELARIYKTNGALALSILTEEDYFGGKKEDLMIIKENLKIPVLRKDFIIDEYQIYESKYHNSDAILLIVRILDFGELKKFAQLAQILKMDVLFEVHSQEDLDKVMELQPRMIGINNRDLDTLEVDLNVSSKLLPQIPEDIFKISESGINKFEDVIYLKSLGADAFLIGESILKAEEPAKKIRSLLGYGEG